MALQLSDFLSLIPPPNRTQPKFMGWMAVNLQTYIDVADVLNTLLTAFDINSANGIQLDIIGEILNLSRRVNFEPSDSSSPILNDDNYRIVLKAKIIQNQWKGTTKEIYDFWTQNFPDQALIIKDNQNMSMDVAIFGLAPGLQQDLVSNGYYMPKPAGVKVNYTFATDPIFAWDLNTDYFKGYDEGYWARFV
jgi:hypothetical protein